MAHEVFVNADLPFFYDFMLTEEVPKDPKQKENFLKLIDRKIAAAKEFNNYLDTIEKKNAQVQPLKPNPQYAEVQRQLSKGIVEGKVFIKLNQDYNHTTFEIDDTKASKKRMEAEVDAATKNSEDAKNKFHEAIADLGKKASSIDTTTIGKIIITDDAVQAHFTKVCHWILDIYYDTPASKFEWDNFKKQVFIADKGEDLKRRIQGLYIPKLYDYQKDTCNYILSTRPMFMKSINDRNFDTLLSTAEEVVKAFYARQEYTNSKKVISDNKTKIIEANLDIQQSEKVSASTKPYINSIYDKLITKEATIRSLNLSDFCPENINEHAFQRGSQQRIGTFLRGEALAKYGEIEDDDKGKKDKKQEKKPEKPAPVVNNETAHTSPDLKPVTKPADVKVNVKQLEYDEEVQMPDVD